MAGLRHIQTGFLAGELDPLMSGRIDTDHYAFGLESCENFACVNEGPLVKRPGFEYVCDAAATASWLAAFRFSITQEYAIEWSEAKARFFTNGGRIETSPGVAYEVSVPYTAVQASALSTQQSFDRLYIDHPAHPPGSLLRTGATTFTYAATTLNNGPFLDANTTESVTVTTSAATGTGITVTASSGIFAAGDVGSQFRIEAKDFSTVKSWEAGMKDVLIGDKVRSDGKVYEALTAGTTGANPPTHSTGDEWDGQLKRDMVNDKGPYGVQWRYLYDRFGIVKITAFTSATVVTADVVRRLPDQVTSVATHRWAHSAFSATRGWPSLVVHAFGRQLHFKDFDVIGSVVGDYGGGQCNFATFTASGALAADLAFRRTMAISNPPVWAAPDVRKVLIGTANEEIAIGAVNAALAVSGDNVGAEPQSYYGSQAVFPAQVGTETVFVERGGRRLRAAGYDFGRDRYVPQDITAAARAVTAGGLVQLAWQRVPYQLLYGVRGDGQLLCHAMTRLEVKGFSRVKLGGGARALSAVSIVGDDGVTDELWLLIERTRADGVKREVWKQARWREPGDAQADQFFVDGGTTGIVAGGQSAFTGFTRFAGQAVAVLANGGVVPGITVAGDGSFTLPAASVPATPYRLTVGLPFVAEAVTLRPPARGANGSIQGLLQRVRKVVMRLFEAAAVKVGAKGDPGLEEVGDLDRPASGAMDAAIPLFTGDAEGVVDFEYSRDGRTRIVSDSPTAATITLAMLSMEADARDA